MKKLIFTMILTMAIMLSLDNAIQAYVNAECDASILKAGSMVQAYNAGAASVSYSGGYCVAEMEVWLVDLDGSAEDTGSAYQENWNGAGVEGPVEAHVAGITGHHYQAYCYSMGTVYTSRYSPQYIIEQYSDDEDTGIIVF